MSDIADHTRAQQMLNEQLEVLGSLRNANTRDPNFKQWRQNTLTVIQRIWPGDPTRGERFRRVPFSAPSSKAETKYVRECYERGCAEASAFLRSLLAEIALVGIPGAPVDARPPSLDPGVAEDDFPTVDLPGGAKPAAPARPHAAESRGEPSVFEMPSLPGAEPARARAPKAPAAKGPARAAKNGRKGGHRQRLKDMLGFNEEDAAAEAASGTSLPIDLVAADALEAPAGVSEPPEAELPAPPPPRRAMPRAVAAPPPLPDTPDSEDLMDEEQDSTAEAGEVEVGPEALADRMASNVAHERADTERATQAEADVEQAMQEFMRLSPVLASEARPVKRKLPDGGPFSAPAALAIAALAGDIEALEVPEGHRSRARATLLDLARRIDARELSWDTLTDAVHFAMEFPAIGRRVLPLLVPYLEQAA